MNNKFNQTTHNVFKNTFTLSDERYKSRTEILASGTYELKDTVIQENFNDKILDAWAEVDFVQFQYIDDIVNEGENSAKWYFGIVAQRAKEAFTRHGLDPLKFSFFCCEDEIIVPEECKTVPAEYKEIPAIYNPNVEELASTTIKIIKEEHSIVLKEGYTIGSKYGICYENALVMEAALQRRNSIRLQISLENVLYRLDYIEKANGIVLDSPNDTTKKNISYNIKIIK